MFCCFILSLSTVSAFGDANNSTIVFEQSVINNSESNGLDIDNSNIVFSPIIGVKLLKLLKIIMMTIFINLMVKLNLNQGLWWRYFKDRQYF